jgi:hypothetical protein
VLYLGTAVTLQQPNFKDVTEAVRRRVERAGGGSLKFLASNSTSSSTPETDPEFDETACCCSEDLNALFRANPLPRQRKELCIDYTVIGHDAERLTSLDEQTSRYYYQMFHSICMSCRKYYIRCSVRTLSLMILRLLVCV